MRSFSRRSLIGHAAAAAVVAGTASPMLHGTARPRVVVVGGGAGGASVAHHLARDAGNALDVVLIEPSRTYHTCFFSNLYLGGLFDRAGLIHGYDRLAALPGLQIVHDWVSSIDPDTRSVRLGSDVRLRYDRLVLSPGIDLVYDSVPGYSLEGSNIAPHAWKSATQLALLRARALAMRPGGTFVYVAPPDPSRCPPGPYERVCMLAHLFKQHNPSAKIVVLDPKEKFAKQALFQSAWEKHYPGMVLWLPASMSGGLLDVDLSRMVFTTELEAFKADAASVVPAQTAATVATRAGLGDDSGWVPVDPSTLQTRANPDIHVLGDAARAEAMPKSAFAANNQAHVVVAALRAALLDTPAPAVEYANTCWSQLAAQDSVKIGARYRPAANGIEAFDSFISELDEDEQHRARTSHEARAWYTAITRDMFG